MARLIEAVDGYRERSERRRCIDGIDDVLRKDRRKRCGILRRSEFSAAALGGVPEYGPIGSHSHRVRLSELPTGQCREIAFQEKFRDLVNAVIA